MEERTKRIKKAVSVLILVGLVVFALTAIGGNLEPTAPPGPTMKTLAEVEPRTPVQSLAGDANSLYVISQPGSYYLTGNITGEPNKCGIRIEANNVTVDLMGFSLIGVPGSLDGFCVQYRETDEPLPIEEVPFSFSIRNGTICNWGGNGIDAYDMFLKIEGAVVEGKILVHSNSELLNVSANSNGEMGFSGRNCCAHMEDVSFCKNGGSGIDAYNGFITIENVEASHNDANGIDAYDMFLQIDGLSARNNTVHGLAVDGNSCCHMEDVAFTYNGGDGMHILGMMTNVDAYSGYASSNGGNGMYVNTTGESYVHMEQVSFNSNDANGVVILGMMTNVDAYSTTTGHNGGNGMYVNTTGESCVHMEQVSFNGNDANGVVILGMMTNVDAYSTTTGYNGGCGIIINGGGNLNQCTVVENGGNGIQAGSGSTVRNCSARGNIGNGIVVSSNCQVVGNTCETNGVDVISTNNPAGIRATGGANRIESNHVVGNNVGIDIDAAGNLIIRNSACGNTTTNYELAADNIAGPTVGSSDIVSSSNPHANYEY